VQDVLGYLLQDSPSDLAVMQILLLLMYLIPLTLDILC